MGGVGRRGVRRKGENMVIYSEPIILRHVLHVDYSKSLNCERIGEQKRLGGKE